jgi:hypothetical protein
VAGAAPARGDLFFSRRRFMLHGFFPETERKLAIARAKRVGRIVMGFTERLAQESLIQSKRDQALLRTPRAENALEIAAERVLGIINAFYINVVQGSQGTGAAFQAGYQLRHENPDEPGGMTSVHRQLLDSYEAAVRSANHKLEQDVRVPTASCTRSTASTSSVRGAVHGDLGARLCQRAGARRADAAGRHAAPLRGLDDKRYWRSARSFHGARGARHAERAPPGTRAVWSSRVCPNRREPPGEPCLLVLVLGRLESALRPQGGVEHEHEHEHGSGSASPAPPGVGDVAVRSPSGALDRRRGSSTLAR